jgi:energy-coupling factor transporter ATP-binding protein EcfA2
VRIVLASVSVVYDAGMPASRRALADASLAIGPRERVALVGPTGAGKTTLLEVAAGLTRPTSGSARLEGGDPGRGLRAAVGLVYQFPESQFFEETVRDDVAFGPRRARLPEDEVEARVERALERAGLPAREFATRAPSTLSEGEKRRAAIAGILALERPFLLLDEPTAGLDPAARERVMGLITDRGAAETVVVVTHDLDLADRVAERTIVMADGAILRDGTTREIMSDVTFLRSLGLDAPMGYLLVDRLRALDPEAAAAVAGALHAGELAEPEGRC